MPYLRGMRSGRCIPNYFIDGVRFLVDGAKAGTPGRNFPFTDLSVAIHPAMVRAVEVYAAPGGIPLQFDLTSSTGCGSIVIWTR
jgi:hypothetical protein